MILKQETSQLSRQFLEKLKIKESFHIERLKPELNKQVEHVNLALHF